MLKNITMKKKMFYALSALLLCSACTTTPRNPFEEPARPAGQESVLKLACEPLDTVRVGFIGLGARGRGAIERYVYLPDAKVVALCDLDSVNVNKANEILTSHKLPRNYGKLQAWLYPVLGVLDRFIYLQFDELRIVPDFGSAGPTVEDRVSLRISARALFIVVAAVRVLAEFWREKVLDVFL